MSWFLKKNPNYYCWCVQLFLHFETQQRTCPELHVALHHAAGQEWQRERDQATLPFCMQTEFTHVNSMNPLHAYPNGPPTGCLYLSWSPASLPLWHPYIHEYRHTSECGPKLRLKWMTDLPMKIDVCVCMHVCEYVHACVPCRVKHKTAAKPCYERRRAVAATHTCTQHVFFVWLYGCMHSLTYAHEKEQHISYLRPSWGVWISGLLTVAGLSVCCSHGLFGATTGNAACT